VIKQLFSILVRPPVPDPCRQPSCAWLHWRFECDRKIFGWMTRPKK